MSRPLSYDTPVTAGRVLVDRPRGGELLLAVGPPPTRDQLVAAAPLIGLLTFLSGWLGVVGWVMWREPDRVPHGGLLMLACLVAWGFAAAELGLQFRNASAPVRLGVAGGTFSFPYPSPRSPAEQVPAERVMSIDVAPRRSLVLRRKRPALRIELVGGVTIWLLVGYPPATLDEVSDLLGPALGLRPAGADAAG